MAGRAVRNCLVQIELYWFRFSIDSFRLYAIKFANNFSHIAFSLGTNLIGPLLPVQNSGQSGPEPQGAFRNAGPGTNGVVPVQVFHRRSR